MTTETVLTDGNLKFLYSAYLEEYCLLPLESDEVIRAIEQAVLQSAEIQSLRTAIAIKDAALRNAQQHIGPVRPCGSSDPDSPQWDADAALWDYYQAAIDAAMEQQK